MAVRDLLHAEAGAAEADVCIVGAGFAGLLAARRLARRGFKVAILESGGRHSNAGSDDLNAVEQEAPRFHRAINGRSRAFGGTSSLWSGRVLPLEADDFEPRPYLGIKGWPIAKPDLDPYLPEIEALFRLDAKPYDDSVQMSLGLPNAGRDKTFEHRWPKWPALSRRNLGATLFPEIRRSEQVTVWLNATVTAHELDRLGGRVNALIAGNEAGHRLRLSAKHFIYAAGTIECTRLLLMLNREADGQPFYGCEALGSWFQDHLDAKLGTIVPTDIARMHNWFTYHFIGRTRRSLHLRLSESQRNADQVAGAYAYASIDFEGSESLQALKRFGGLLQGKQPRANFVRTALSVSPRTVASVAASRVLRKRLFLPHDMAFDLRVCAEQTPVQGNRITLSERVDRLGTPRARIKWAPGDQDERTFRATARRLATFWRGAGFDRFSRLDWTNRAGPIISYAEDFAHPSGSTRMGPNPRSSVVGPDLRCWHVPNVSVISASVFPSAGASNPTCTIMQLALRAAAGLKL